MLMVLRKYTSFGRSLPLDKHENTCVSTVFVACTFRLLSAVMNERRGKKKGKENMVRVCILRLLLVIRIEAIAYACVSCCLPTDGGGYALLD